MTCTVTHIRFEHTDDGVVIARADSRCAWEALALVAGALCKTAHAYAYGLGHPVDDHAWWAVPRPRRGRHDVPSRGVLSR